MRNRRYVSRITCLLLFCCVLFGALVACGTQNGAASVTTNAGEKMTEATTVVTEDPAYVEELPELDFTGYELKMHMRNSDFFISDQYIESFDTAVSFVDRAVFERNEAVSERFGGIYYTIGRSDSDNYDISLYATIQSGSCDWDVVINHGHSLSKYAQGSLMTDLYTVPNLDLSKKYWDQNMINDFKINGKMFFIGGDISYQLLGHTDSMVFNKGLCNDLGLEEPYGAVLSGDWTFELFSQMVKCASGDENGDGKLVLEDGDIMGYVTDKYCGPINVLYSGGGRVSSNDGTTFALTLYNDRHITIFDKFFEFVEQDNCQIFTDWNSSSELVKFRRQYAAGNVLFMDLRTYEISTLIQEGMLDYGVIPWPKWDDTVEGYHSWVDAGANQIGIPKARSEERLEFIGAVLEALCAEGHRTVLPMYYEQILKLKLAQDPQSYEVMDLIKAGRVYDMASYWGSPVGMPGYYLVSYSGHNFTTWWQSQRSQAEYHVKTLNELFSKWN